MGAPAGPVSLRAYGGLARCPGGKASPAWLRSPPLRQWGNSFIRVYYDRDLQVRFDRRIVDPKAQLSLIHLMSYQRILVVDRSVLNPVFFQPFFFELYDPEIFDFVVRNPMA